MRNDSKPVRRPRAILIDLDDTIIDDSSHSDAAWSAVVDGALKTRTGLVSAVLLAEIHRVRTWFWSDPERHRVGRQDMRKSTTEIVHAALNTLDHCDPILAREIAHAYRDRREAAVELFPGAIDALVELKARGIRLAMVTNGAATAQRAKIDRFDLARHFDYILVEGEFGLGKPDERVYHAAMSALGSSPTETWMVGDNFEWEVVVPARIGLTTVWIDRPGREPAYGSEVKAHYVVRSLSEITRLLDEG